MSELSYVEEKVPIDMLKEDQELKSIVPPNNMKDQLASSIAKNGQTLPIDVDEDYVILDGYTRVSILKTMNYKEVKVRRWNFKSSEDRVTAYKLVAMLNLQRRHLEKHEVLRLIREVAEKIERLSKEQNNSTVRYRNTTNVGSNSEPNNENNRIDYESLKKAQELIGAKDISEKDLDRYSRISSLPWLRQLVDDGKISVVVAYELYMKAKDKLQKIGELPKYEREQLVTTREGRKIILERDDLLQQILDHKLAVSQAISMVKVEEKKKKQKEEEAKKEKEGTSTEGAEQTETKGETTETVKEPSVEVPEGVQSETVTEVSKAKVEVPQTEVKEEPEAKVEKPKEEKKPEKRKKEELPPTEIEHYSPKPNLDELYASMPTVKKLVEEGKFTEEDAEKTYEVWKSFRAILMQASYLWYNSMDRLLQKKGMPEEEREKLFYEMLNPFCRMFKKEEIFPKEYLEGRW